MRLLVLQLAVTFARKFSPVTALLKVMPVFICIQLLQRGRPHRVLPSCRCNGGFNDALTRRYFRFLGRRLAILQLDLVPLPSFYSRYIDWVGGLGEFYPGVVAEGEK